MNRHDEAHSACLNILNDSQHSAVRIAELCTFTRALGGEIDEISAERDRLAAENAELRAKLDPEALTICYMSGQATGDAEARALAKRLRAANAMLGALREAVPEDSLDFDEMYPDRDFDDLELVLRSILYPQEKTTDDE